MKLFSLLPFAACTAATCTSFESTSSAYYLHPKDQEVRVSTAVWCPKVGYSGPQCYIGTSNPVLGCKIVPRGLMSGHGFTNLSISAEDEAPLYDLVGDAVGAHLAQKRVGCFQHHTREFDCIPRKDYGAYLTFIPGLTCFNGTLRGCSKDGPIQSGTAVALCGVPRGNFYVPVHGYEVVRDVTEAEAKRLDQPTDNMLAKCCLKKIPTCGKTSSLTPDAATRGFGGISFGVLFGLTSLALALLTFGL